MKDERSVIEMKLSDFIQANAGQILDAWEKFAAGISPERHLSTAQLRDHASGMLSAIIADLNCAQTPLEQIEKSKGRAPRSARDTYAVMHGLDRESSGFGMNDTMSEFRALRANMAFSKTKCNTLCCKVLPCQKSTSI